MVRGKYRGGGRRGGAPRPSKDASDSESSEDEFTRKKIGGQASNVGMLPPSSSEDEDSDAKGGQNPNVGALPPSDSDSDSDSEDGGKAATAKAKPAVPAAPSEAARRRKAEEGPSEAQMREDMERLELIKKRREEQRLKRIADEGWDRFAPMTETNKPPLPGDYVKKAEAE